MAVVLFTWRLPHLLEIEEEIPQLVKQTKVQDFTEVNVKEFLDNIFKSKRKYLCAFVLK